MLVMIRLVRATVARMRRRVRAVALAAGAGRATPEPMAARIARWQAVYRARRVVTWEEVQARHAEQMRINNEAALDEIARTIAAERCWMGAGHEAGPLLTFEEWASRSVLDGERRGE